MKPSRLATFALATAVLTLAFGAPGASAKSIVDYFGTDPLTGQGTLGGEFRFPGGVAVNQTGAGPADAGDIYVVDRGAPALVDRRNHRIQRFHRDDNGTPAFPYDDTWQFVSAWGADVVQDGGAGDRGDAADANFEICTVVAQCKAGVPTGGNGTAAGNGALDFPQDVAIDQDTGDVYVTDAENARVNVYSGDGTFLRSFGFDVVASGPGEQPAPNERQQLTVRADGGRFALSFRGAIVGGRGTGTTTRGSRVVTDVTTTSGAFAVGQAFTASGGSFDAHFPPGTTITAIGANTITVSQAATIGIPVNQNPDLIGYDLDFDSTAQEVEDALNALPSIGGVGGSVEVTGGPGDATGSTPYTIEFGGGLAGDDVPQLTAHGGGLSIGSGTPSATVSTLAQGGAHEVCEDADGDVCGPGAPGAAVGQIGIGAFALAKGIAVSQPDANPATGTVFVTDPANRRINTYGLDGFSPGSIGSAAEFAAEEPTSIAVDSRGILYAGATVNFSDVERYDTRGANGPVGFLAPIPISVLAGDGYTPALEVDLDTDGPGPDTDVLYALRTNSGPSNAIRQFGPVNAPGLSAPPAAADEAHGTGGQVSSAGGLAIDETGGHIYATAFNTPVQSADGVYVLHDAGSDPTASLDSLTDITATSVRANATIDPNGPPPVSYRFEYSLDGSRWTALPSTVLGIQDDPQAIGAVLSPPGTGFDPGTLYYVRLVAAKKFATPVITPALTFTTDPAPPDVETAGAPVRSTTTAQLNGRVNPRGDATTFHFEYVTEEAFQSTGFSDLSSGGSTTPVPAGSDNTIELAGAEITGLEPNTEYRYRILADNSNPGSPVAGDDMALRTRLTEELPNQNKDFPGPPSSDRAWEQVSLAESSGNAVVAAWGFSDDSERAAYGVAGGTPISDRGSAFSVYYAERNETAPHQGGWQTQWIAPPSADLVGGWFDIAVNSDLSTIIGRNTSTDINQGLSTYWRFGPDISPQRLLDVAPPQSKYSLEDHPLVSDDATRVVATPISGGTLDPAYPAATAQRNLYDVSDGGDPQLASLLPGERIAACEVPNGDGSASNLVLHPPAHSLSADGRYLYFPNRGDDCSAPTQLYLRDLVAGESKLISAPTLSGHTCAAAFIRSTADAAFFWTQGRLDAEDTNPADCGGSADGDVYRYDVATEALECMTCVVAGLDADVSVSLGYEGTVIAIGVAGDGSRLYFRSGTRLLPGAPPGAVYRLDTDTGDLASVGPLADAQIGRFGHMTPDGSVLYFQSPAAALNPLGEGADNGGTDQWYRYDDADRSLICVSCPQDGTPASADAYRFSAGSGRNITPLSTDGKTIAFATPVALLGADQNTDGDHPDAGADVYEWRDGRLALITDGLTGWSPIYGTGQPEAIGVSSTGRDVFFVAAAQLTPDALDGFSRLYTARIGGGFSFPEPDPPCPLEVCQGTPRGAPPKTTWGSTTFSGRGNLAAQPSPRRCPRGKRRVMRKGRVRCVPRKRGQRSRAAKHKRRGQR